jgi:hypothetical protein
LNLAPSQTITLSNVDITHPHSRKIVANLAYFLTLPFRAYTFTVDSELLFNIHIYIFAHIFVLIEKTEFAGGLFIYSCSCILVAGCEI